MKKGTYEGRACVFLFTGVYESSYGRYSEAFAANLALTLLHEMMHVYGVQHEHEHAGNVPGVEGYSDAVETVALKKNAIPRTNPKKDYGAHDPDSVMSYRDSDEKLLKDISHSSGDVALLQFLYKRKGTPEKSPIPEPSQTPSVSQISEQPPRVRIAVNLSHQPNTHGQKLPPSVLSARIQENKNCPRVG